MSATWNGPYIEVAKIDNLGTIKEVTDNGRTVSRIYALRAQGAPNLRHRDDRSGLPIGAGRHPSAYPKTRRH